MSLHAALQGLEYPCEYPFKLICQPLAIESVRACILTSIGESATITDSHQRASRNGKYIALTITINATNAPQIEQVYAALRGVTGIVTSL
jgi:putative lipoic acid-binding regulatory protein